MISVVESGMGLSGEEIHANENADAQPQVLALDVPAGSEVSIFRVFV